MTTTTDRCSTCNCLRNLHVGRDHDFAEAEALGEAQPAKRSKKVERCDMAKLLKPKPAKRTFAEAVAQGPGEVLELAPDEDPGTPSYPGERGDPNAPEQESVKRLEQNDVFSLLGHNAHFYAGAVLWGLSGDKLPSDGGQYHRDPIQAVLHAASHGHSMVYVQAGCTVLASDGLSMTERYLREGKRVRADVAFFDLVEIAGTVKRLLPGTVYTNWNPTLCEADLSDLNAATQEKWLAKMGTTLEEVQAGTLWLNRYTRVSYTVKAK